MPSVEELQELERQNLANGNGNNGHEQGALSIEELAEHDGANLFTEESDEEPVEVIEGATGQLSLAVGGRKPDSATMRMGAKEVPLADKTQFVKGTVVKLHVKASIDEIKFRDKKDGAGEVTHTTRAHIAVPLSVRRMSLKDALEAAAMDFLYEGDFEDDADKEQVLRAVVENVIVQVREDDAEIK